VVLCGSLVSEFLKGLDKQQLFWSAIEREKKREEGREMTKIE